LEKKNLKKKGWGCGSSGRIFALQGQDPKFKPHYHQKKKASDPDRLINNFQIDKKKIGNCYTI
jgi:hypothetical protein